MSATINRSTILRLSVDERLKLMDLIWDTLVEQEADVTLPNETLLEMQHRLAEARAHPEQNIPVEEFERRLRARFG